VTILLDDDTVQAVFDWTAAIGALRDAYLADSEPGRYPPRTIARAGGNSLRLLGGVPGGAELMGVKIIAGARSVRQVSYLIALFDQRSAELVALLDANSLTGYRTAATSALATDLLTPPGPLTVAVIGSGFEARKHVRALAAVRDLERVQVYSPRRESRARFAADLADLSAPVIPAETAEAAAAGVSVIVCAARSYDETPVLCGAWVRPGATVVSIGSTVPGQREVDPEVIVRADVVIADVVDEVLHETGDLIAAREAGVNAESKTASLADLIGGRHPGRADAGQIVLYKSVGSAVQDLAIAAMCVRNAERLGSAATLPIKIQPVRK
jgi:alanine dehydrogenase